jgi:hypothetical protein
VKVSLEFSRRGWGLGMDYCGGRLDLMFFKAYLIIERRRR